MKDLLNQIAELKAEVSELQSKLQSQDETQVESYTYEDYMQMGSRQVSKMNIDNCHDLIDLDKEMSLASNELFARSLVFTDNNGKWTITSANQKIRIIPNRKDIMQFELNGYTITGKKKVILIKYIMQHSELFDTSSDNGWDIYIIRYNGRVYTVGFMESDYGTVAFMKDYVQFEHKPTTEEYYKIYRRTHPQDLWVTRKWELDASEDMYGWKGANNMAIFQEDQLEYAMDMALDAGRISDAQYLDIMDK